MIEFIILLPLFFLALGLLIHQDIKQKFNHEKEIK
jgi:hypothetical protein